MTNPNDPISPLPVEHITNGMTTDQTSGLTKLEEFANAAMQGYCANPDYTDAQFDSIAEYSVKQAGALIAALNASKPQE